MTEYRRPSGHVITDRMGMTIQRRDDAGPDVNLVQFHIRCPYCGSALTGADATRDGEALYCADCGHRVEFFDVLEEAEEEAKRRDDVRG